MAGALPAIWQFRGLATQHFSKTEMRQDDRLIVPRDGAGLIVPFAGNLAICIAALWQLPAIRHPKFLATRSCGKTAKRQSIVAPFAWLC